MQERVAGVAHAIKLKEGAEPLFQLLRNLSLKELGFLREYLESALRNK
jgi:hypothetical protein